MSGIFPLIRIPAQFIHRLILAYFVCFIFPFPLYLLDLPVQLMQPEHRPEWLKEADQSFGKAFEWMQKRKDNACVWVGENILEKEVKIQITGSGDSMRSYVGCLLAFGVALIVALLWTMFVGFIEYATKSKEWRSVSDQYLFEFVTILVRLFLVSMFFGYGFAKLFPNQFPMPTYRAEQTFGSLSPMGLVWAFMGFSPPYQMFTGAVEIIAGLLLATRRTTFLGAICAVVAMTQVVLLNLCFDVPVKLYALHYLVMSIYLLLPYLPRFFKVFVQQHPVEVVAMQPRFNSEVADWILLILRTLFLAMLLCSHIDGNYKRWKNSHPEKFAAPGVVVLKGKWERVKEDAEVAELPWKQLDFTFPGGVTISSGTPPILRYRIEYGDGPMNLVIAKFTDPSWRIKLKYGITIEAEGTPEEKQTISISGEINQKPFTMSFQKLPEKKYELFTRGFHWISELPYNR